MWVGVCVCVCTGVCVSVCVSLAKRSFSKRKSGST